MIQELTEDNDRLRTSLELIGNKYKKLKDQHADISNKLADDETLLKENARIITNLEQEVLELNGLKVSSNEK